MPAPQLHLTFGERVAHHPGVVAPMREAVAREPVYTHLGSIFHDLPYYGNMLAEVIRYGLHRPAIDAPWAYRMHCMRPDKFVASYIRAARSVPGLDDHERLALVAGLLSHCALDLTLHPLVNYCARRDTALYGGHETFHHRITEKYHALFFHIERCGDDVIGTREFARKTTVVKQGSLRGRVEPAILDFMRRAYEGYCGDAPDGDRWSRWVRNMRHFGLLVSSPIASMNSHTVRKMKPLVERYYRPKTGEFDFDDFYVHSERRLAELVNLGWEYFSSGDDSLAAEDRFCAAARIDDLADPDPAGLPALPELPTRVAPPRRAMRLRVPVKVSMAQPVRAFMLRRSMRRAHTQAGAPPSTERAA